MPQRTSEILAEKPSGPSAARPRGWALGLASVPLLGVVAAFGIAPDTSPERVAREQVVQDIPLALAEPAARPQHFWREERIQRGDTVASILARLQVDDPAALAYLRSARGVRSLYQLVPGRTLRAVTTEEGALISLRYLHGDGTELTMDWPLHPKSLLMKVAAPFMGGAMRRATREELRLLKEFVER